MSSLETINYLGEENLNTVHRLFNLSNYFYCEIFLKQDIRFYDITLRYFREFDISLTSYSKDWFTPYYKDFEFEREIINKNSDNGYYNFLCGTRNIIKNMHKEKNTSFQIRKWNPYKVLPIKIKKGSYKHSNKNQTIDNRV